MRTLVPLGLDGNPHTTPLIPGEEKGTLWGLSTITDPETLGRSFCLPHSARDSPTRRAQLWLTEEAA